MSNPFRSNPQLDRQISQAATPDDLRQLLHNSLESAGVISHEHGNGEVVVPLHATVPVASAPALPDRNAFSQSARRTIYPYGNLRLDISGVDEEALDAIEERIRQSFERQ